MSDKSKRSRPGFACHTIERLDDRIVLTAANFGVGLLTVSGDASANAIVINAAANLVTVTDNANPDS